MLRDWFIFTQTDIGGTNEENRRLGDIVLIIVSGTISQFLKTKIKINSMQSVGKENCYSELATKWLDVIAGKQENDNFHKVHTCD